MRIIPCQKCGKPITVYGADDKPNYTTQCQDCGLVWKPRKSRQKAVGSKRRKKRPGAGRGLFNSQDGSGSEAT